ncbi:MAG: DUF2238 domain-containing protein [Gammaproteobacteria bacterium]|nr:DUF2238 domain-containing protein [Gammaproteobacteria bacterium]MBL6999650.1 DUF2238 domain-containing protein [Gammaproteobacteria bacterium]
MKYLWALIYLLTLIWSAIDPYDGFTWWLEVAPALIAAVVLLLSFNSFRLTPLLYTLILLHCIVLMVGGHYTYAEVPLFESMKEWFGFERNNYDKLGHFMQGFVPALLAREILIRKQVMNGRGWLNLFVVCFSLAFSALYELIEWWVALASGENADAFLGTQGYVWDTQSDMGMALLGALLAIVLLARLHDRQLRHI